MLVSSLVNITRWLLSKSGQRRKYLIVIILTLLKIDVLFLVGYAYYDVALLELYDDIKYSISQYPICLPQVASYNLEKRYNKKTCFD